MKTFEIDGGDIWTLEDFYDQITRVLIPNADLGLNLDIFDDILRGGYGTPDEGFRLRWSDHNVSRQRLGYGETVRQLEKRLKRCHRTMRANVQADLDRARAGEGPTVFDWLVDIIRNHGPGGGEPKANVQLYLA